MDKSHLPIHHPDGDLLAAYSSGAANGARALLAATHLTYCPDCRKQVAALESVGGELLDQEQGIETGAPPLADTQTPHGVSQQDPDHGDFPFAPKPLRTVLKQAGAQWTNVWFGVKELQIPGFSPAVRLLWIPPDRKMPRHDHHGEELTLVLKGNFSDATGTYSVGDLQIGRPGMDHQPHAGHDGPCICLVAEEGGLKLSGWMGRLISWRGGNRAIPSTGQHPSR